MLDFIEGRLIVAILAALLILFFVFSSIMKILSGVASKTAQGADDVSHSLAKY
tara:strand:+ start:13224 stop:13382 length:159 start_codon:yes stop_codon:yes gene_type:complete